MSHDPALRAPIMTPENMLFVGDELYKWLKADRVEIGLLDPHGNVEGPFGQAQIDVLVEALELWLLCFAHEHPTAKPVNPY